MKKFTLLLFVTFLTISVFAQNADKKWAFGIGAGPYWTRSHSSLTDDNTTFGSYFTGEAYLSRYLSPAFDLMVKANPGWKTLAQGVDLFNVGLNLRYNFLDAKKKFRPYLFAGPTFLGDNDETGINFNGGLGFRYKLGRDISLYAEGAYLNGIKETPSTTTPSILLTDNHFKVTAGLEFAFGKPRDEDKDGVPDRKDKCPGTPAGVKVDVNGCPLDRDGDGIPDYKDDCPDTPGLAAFNGCPDKDGDGIMDKEDDCPDVPGLKQFKGCPDSDGDGVPDPKDECPNTPKGCKVDAKGCPLDTDKDGIIDCQDKCPNEPGVKELQGCPIICKDFEVPPVYFDFDKATLRPEGMAALDAFIAQLGDCKKYDIVVDGYTCSIGTKKYNIGLSEERAQEVVKYLISKGVNNAFVASKGFGEDNPALPNTNKANREKNRRAVVELTIK